jgi:hypothetical protein
MAKKSQVILEKFWKTEQYLEMKMTVETNYFKLDGEYHKFDEKTNTLKKISLSSIKEHFKNKTLEIVFDNEVYNPELNKMEIKKEKIEKDFYTIWSSDPNLKEYDDIVFSCDENIDNNVFNLYKGFPKFKKQLIEESKTISLEPIYEHINSLVNYNEEHFEYVLNWLSHIAQYTESPAPTCLIFISQEGVGKDIFSNFISHCFNPNYCINTQRIENITGKFNSAIASKIFVTINELDAIESRENIEAIKYLITAEDILLEQKYRDPIKVKNYARYMFFSNQLTSFPAGGRRPIIFYSSSKHLPNECGVKESEKYFSKLVEFYKNPVYQCAFLRMLFNRDISKWNPKEVTKSELQQELIDTSISPVAKWLADVVQNNLDKETVKISSVQALSECNNYMRNNHYKHDLNATKFSVELTTIYKVKKVKNSTNFFVFDIKDLRELLEKKLGFKFEKAIVEEDDEEEDEELNNMKKELIMLRAFRAQYEEQFQKFKVQYDKQNKEEKVEVVKVTEDEEEEVVEASDDDFEAFDNIVDKLLST